MNFATFHNSWIATIDELCSDSCRRRNSRAHLDFQRFGDSKLQSAMAKAADKICHADLTEVQKWTILAWGMQYEQSDIGRLVDGSLGKIAKRCWHPRAYGRSTARNLPLYTAGWWWKPVWHATFGGQGASEKRSRSMRSACTYRINRLCKRGVGCTQGIAVSNNH